MGDAGVWKAAAVRFLAHLPLYAALPVVAFVATLLFRFPGEHPFHVGGEPEYERFPAYLSATVITPCWFGLGALAGLIFSARSRPPVRYACLCLLCAWAAVLSHHGGSVLAVPPWPLWMHALCALAAATAVCRWYPVPRR